MFFVLSLCCLSYQREFVHVPSTELSSKIHQKQLVMTHHNSSLVRTGCEPELVFLQLGFPRLAKATIVTLTQACSLCVPLVEL